MFSFQWSHSWIDVLSFRLIVDEIFVGFSTISSEWTSHEAMYRIVLGNPIIVANFVGLEVRSLILDCWRFQRKINWHFKIFLSNFAVFGIQSLIGVDFINMDSFVKQFFLTNLVLIDFRKRDLLEVSKASVARYSFSIPSGLSSGYIFYRQCRKFSDLTTEPKSALSCQGW
jgi:hypothetical protein